MGSLFEQSNNKKINNCKEVHARKLDRLVQETVAGSHNPDTVIFNYSSYDLSDMEKKVLCYGLNFSIPPKKLNYAEFMLPFEKMYTQVMNERMAGNSKEQFRTGLKNLAFSTYSQFNTNQQKVLTDEEKSALKALKENENIVIQKTGKGNSIVVIDKLDYVNSLLELLEDQNKFTEIKIPEGKDILNIMLAHEKNIVDFVKTLRINYKEQHHLPGGISDNNYWKIYPQGTRPGRLYGNAKVHKALVNGIPPFRPIISAIGTSSHKIARFILPILKPHSTNNFTLTDSFKFKNEILEQDGKLHMGTMDIESLFTNLPLDETIDLCIQLVYKDTELVQGLNSNEFKQLLKFATKESMFMFNNKYYKQVDGIAMGSPLGPVMANIFLSHSETIWLEQCLEDITPKYYRRYVDDIFVLFDNEEKCNSFCQYINTKHPNLKFKAEYEQDNTISFLDVLIERQQNKFTTNVYRKDTFSGVFSNYNSFIPKSYKSGLILSLLFRLSKIVSDPEIYIQEVGKLKDILLKNAYPYHFIDTCFQRFQRIRPPPIANNETNNQITIVLPYLGKFTANVQKELKRMFKTSLPKFNIRLISKSSYRIANLFRFKDTYPESITSNINYLYTCSSCKAAYVGKTYRHKRVRLCEHMGISPRTGKLVKGTAMTAVREHMLNCNTKVAEGDFTILSKGGEYKDLEIKESLLIKKLKPVLNKDQLSRPLYLFR